MSTLEDGSVERRYRLQRPLDRSLISHHALEASHWHPVTADAFAAAWREELATIPEMIETRLHMVTGLLLPIWKQLPPHNPKIYRLATDSGERLIGRLIDAEQVPVLRQTFGLTGGTVLDAGQAVVALLERDATLPLPARKVSTEVRFVSAILHERKDG